MKNLIFLVLLALLSLSLPMRAPAQETSKVKSSFSTLAVFREPEMHYKGYLVALKDSSMVFSTSRRISIPWKANGVEEKAIADVEMLKVRRRSGPVIGALVGFALGTGAGFLISSSTKARSGEGFETLIYALDEAATDMATVSLCTLVGTGIGAAIGSSRKKFVISGSQDNYVGLRVRLEKYAMKK